MNRAVRFLALAMVFAGAVGLTGSPEARAQPIRVKDPAQQPLVAIPGGGTELFRALLDKEGVQPVTQRDINNGNVRPSDELIVIVIGTPPVVPRGEQPAALLWVRWAVAANGAALVATDGTLTLHRAQANQFAIEPIVEFNGNTVHAAARDSHDGRVECPYAVPVSPDEIPRGGQKPGPVWGVFRGLNKLATNDPTCLVMKGEFRGECQYPLARLPKSSVLPVWPKHDVTSALFATGGDGPEQRFNGRPGYSFLAVADSSVFINQMLMEPGTDNLELTLRTIEYLQGPQKHRKQCLFYENGKVIEKFDGLRSALAKPKPKIPPEAMPNVPGLIQRNQDKLVELGDRLADDFQTNDKLHRGILGRPGSEEERRMFGRLVQVAVVLAAIMITLLLLSRTLRARHPLDSPPAPNTGAGVASTGPPGVFDRRQKEMVRRNNLYEPVRNLMREFFDAVGAPANPGPRIPPLEISDVVRKPESLRQAIRDMWRIAYGPPQPITAQRWFELEPYFDRLRKAHTDGKWRFVTD